MNWKISFSSLQPYIVGAVLAFAVAGGAWYALSTLHHTAGVPYNITAVRPLGADDHIRGNKNARIQVIVYTNPECPYCKDFHQKALPMLLQKYGQQIVVAYRYLYLQTFDKSRSEEEAIECAAKLSGEDAFWNFTDALFAITPLENRLDYGVLSTIAASIGISKSAFVACEKSGETRMRVEKDSLEAETIGIIYSPTIIVRGSAGTIVIDADNHPQIRAAIDYLLSKQK